MWTIVGDSSVNLIFKNVNLSNDSRVSKRNVKSYSNQYVLNGSIQNHVFDASLFKGTPNISNSEIWESFLSWMFLQYFEGCPCFLNITSSLNFSWKPLASFSFVAVLIISAIFKYNSFMLSSSETLLFVLYSLSKLSEYAVWDCVKWSWKVRCLIRK